MNNTNLKLFPNPSSGVFTLQMKKPQYIKVQIYNIIGSIIYQDSFVLPQSTIDLSNESPGIYFLLASSGDDTWSQKIIRE